MAFSSAGPSHPPPTLPCQGLRPLPLTVPSPASTPEGALEFRPLSIVSAVVNSTYHRLWNGPVNGPVYGMLSGMGGFSWSFALSLLALACSALAVVVTVRRTPSAIAQAALKTAEDTLRRWHEECQLFEATRARWSEEFAGIVDRCEETLDRTESKRRRIAANSSRENQNNRAGAGGNGGDPWAGMSRDEIVAAGRRLLSGRA